jgi:uncharacterized membrane protein YeaQ/YmgE (transglycosylase-associated protein family)
MAGGMMQSRTDSVMEALCNIVVGICVAMIANALFIPLVTSAPLQAGDNLALALIYTVISFVRSYAIRRAFNGRSIWQAIRSRYERH